MSKKFTLLVFVALLLGLFANPVVHAATRYWDNEGGDNRWDNPLNWSGDCIPTGQKDHARIVLADAGGCLIDAAVSADPKNMWVGYFDGTTAAAGSLRMTGGSLAPWNIFVGRESTGRFDMEGGTVDTVKGLHIGQRLGGDGSLVMSGGTINVGPQGDATRTMSIGNQGATGHVTMTDGTINVSGALGVGVNVGADGVTGGYGVLDMLGGTISVGYVPELQRDMQIGIRNGTGIVNMSDGVIDINGDLVVGVTYFDDAMVASPGTGTLTMTGGLISVADANAIEIGLEGSTGLVDLLGGTLTAGDLLIGETGSSMNITAGTLVLVGDQTAALTAYADAGLLTAFGGASGAALVYDVSEGKTTVTAIPEPATIALLGLAALFASRRRRKG